MSESPFLKSANACLANGKRLLEDADWIHYKERPAATSFVLAIIAQEEFAKAFLLLFADRGAIKWSAFLHRATRDHSCKHLVGLVLDYLAPDWENEKKRSDEWLAEISEHRRLMGEYERSSDESERDKIWNRVEEISAKWNSLPPTVADAIFILRHEKLSRWESSRWLWAENPDYEPRAKGVADGQVDRLKQDAFYVRLGSDGQVAETPLRVKYDDAKTAIESAERMRSHVESLIQGKGFGPEEENVELAFKVIFGNSNQESAEAS